MISTELEIAIVPTDLARSWRGRDETMKAVAQPPRGSNTIKLVIAIVVAIVGVVCAISNTCAHLGRHRAQKTCDATAIGSSIDDVRVRAKAQMDLVYDVPDRFAKRDADAGDPDGDQDGVVDAHAGTQDSPTPQHRKRRVSSMAVGFVFLRYFCDVEYEDGKVTSKRLSDLD